MGVNSLPKTVIPMRRDCDLNPRPSAPESSTLTTRLRSHPDTTVLAHSQAVVDIRLRPRVRCCPLVSQFDHKLTLLRRLFPVIIIIIIDIFKVA